MNYSNCKWCGSRLPQNSKKCESCGKESDVQFVSPQAPGLQKPKTRISKQKTSRRAPSNSRFIVPLIILGIFLYRMWPELRSLIPNQFLQSLTPSPQPISVSPVQIPTELMKVRDPKLSGSNLDLTPMLNGLKSKNADVRRTSVDELGKAGTAARPATAALGALLNDPDDYVRESVVDALGKCCLESPEIIPLLNQVLLDPNHTVRKYAVLYLGQMGPKAKDAVPGLIRVLHGNEIYLRVWAAEALGNIGPDAAAALPRLREMQNEKIVSDESEASQLPDTLQTAIRKIEEPR